MEKFTQFRDRGSGISPFSPIDHPSSWATILLHTVVFLFRLPIFFASTTIYLLLLHPLTRFLPVVVRKLLLWGLMSIPGIWWVDLQLDGVKRGSLSQQPPSRVPHPGSVIAASFTSPIDALYLAAVFDPVFTVSYPNTRKVQRVGRIQAVALALAPPSTATPPPFSGLTTVRALLAAHPGRVIAVFPETTTTNGRGILPFSPSLLTVPSSVAIFPVSLRYSPPDIATPVPGLAAALAFAWKLLGRPTHSLRVRIAEGLHNDAANNVKGAVDGDHDDGEVTREEQLVLDHIAEALARLGRNKRVGLTARDKAAFVDAWTSKGTARR